MWSVCGSNFQQGHHRGKGSYYFSIYADPWGWATWRRAWSCFPKAERLWPQVKENNLLERKFSSALELRYWSDIFDCLFIERKPDTWDYQWFLSGFIESAVHAWPNTSLIENCGFGIDATHTFGKNPFSSKSRQLFEIEHPELVLADTTADEIAFDYRFDGRRSKERARLGRLYPWAMRLRMIKEKGIFHYLLPKIRSKISDLLSSVVQTMPRVSPLEACLLALKPVGTDVPMMRIGGNGDGGYLCPDDLVGIGGCVSLGAFNIKHFEDQLWVNWSIPSLLIDASSSEDAFETPMLNGQFLDKKWLMSSSAKDAISLEEAIDHPILDASKDLLLQLDIEGAEYININSWSPRLLRRFRIIIVEFLSLIFYSALGVLRPRTSWKPLIE